LSLYSKMSQLPPILNLQEDDIMKMLACSVHLGSTNISAGMERYVHDRNEAGNHIIDLRKTWEKLILAARIIAAVENPKDVAVVGLAASGTVPYSQRAVLKFSKHVGARSFAGRFTPGTFTNQQQHHYVEPTVLVLSDPIKDHQPLMESSYMNIPVLAFCNTNVHLRNIDVVIPANTEGPFSIALLYWLLAREVLRLQGKIPRDKEWVEMVDMFIYKDPEEQEKLAEEPGNKTRHQTWADADGTGEDWDGTSPVVGDTGETWGQSTEWVNTNDQSTGEWDNTVIPGDVNENVVNDEW